jgi:putative Ig domain-containing protein
MSFRTLVTLAALTLVLGACGRAPSTGASETPPASPSGSASPTVQPSPLTVPGPTLHNGEVGVAYTAVTYTATGGTDAYLWTVSGGALPGGLTLSQDGIVSGTPTAAGTFFFTVEVTDAAMATAHLGGQIDIAPRLAAYYVGAMTRGNVLNLCGAGTCPNTDDPHAAFGAVSGGVAPYTYAVVSGALPRGMSLNGFALSGTPYMSSGIRNEDVYTFTVRVKDSFGVSAQLLVNVDVFRGLNSTP